MIRHVARDQVAIEIADGATAIAEVVPPKNANYGKGSASRCFKKFSSIQWVVGWTVNLEYTKTSFRAGTPPALVKSTLAYLDR
ncbi:MAG TPA: hypothetical protein DCF63_06460 [Planctomycetaceae bacterium]|nr:hypothetical protein [Planctomycetaceae bacterium]